MKIQIRLALALAGTMAAGLAHAQLETEKLDIEKLPERSPHWVYVGDITFFNMPDSRIVLLDGDADSLNAGFLGMVSTGYNPTFAVSPDGSELYSAETYYSRGTRGEREDIVTIFDTATLEPVGEIDIPEKRHHSLLQPQGMVTTAGGDNVLVFNATPATSTSVVDLKNREFLNEIPLPGCALLYPAPEGRQFGTLCTDGSLVTINYDESGKEIERKRISLFEPQSTRMFEKPVYVDDTLYFISRVGEVYPVDWSGELPRVGETWQLASAEEREQNWRPGGWQLEAAHAPTNRLFVLMHQGGEFTHKDPGSEVWIYDVTKGERIDRISLKNPATSILATADDDPLLFAIRADFGMDIYDATSGEYLKSFEGFASTPFTMRRP